MKTVVFQDFLIKSAMFAIACDGKIDASELSEIKDIAENEIYFMGYDYEQPIAENLSTIKEKGMSVINHYLNEDSFSDLSEKQEIILIEVLIRAIESDGKIEPNEIKFIQMIKSKLKISEELLIATFPKHLNLLKDFNNFGSLNEFSENLNIEIISES
jgi:uncharacterized membrane protein YebE (DUF533 family)